MTDLIAALRAAHEAAPFPMKLQVEDGALFTIDDVLSCCNIDDDGLKKIALFMNNAGLLLDLAAAAVQWEQAKQASDSMRQRDHLPVRVLYGITDDMTQEESLAAADRVYRERCAIRDEQQSSELALRAAVLRSNDDSTR